MNLSDLGTLVAEKGGTLLGGLIKGGVPGVAAEAVKLVAGIFGGDTPEEIAKNIKLTSDAQVKLAEIQSTERLKLQELAIKMAEISGQNEQSIEATDHQDRSSARQREVDLDKILTQIGKRDRMPSVLSIMIVVGFFLCIGAIMVFPTNVPAEKILFIMFGTLGAAFMSVVNYYFGSSRGSKVKEEALNYQLTHQKPAGINNDQLFDIIKRLKDLKAI